MPKVHRRRRLLKQTPSCLCNRSLGKSLKHAHNFHVVSCSNSSCKRTVLYLHQSCARLYIDTVGPHCSLCKRKLVSNRNFGKKSLSQVLQEVSRGVRWRKLTNARAS